MIVYLAAEYFFLCALNTNHPTIFIDEDTRECIAICDKDSYPVACYKDGKSITDCFDDNGNSMLCDAYIYEISKE